MLTKIKLKRDIKTDCYYKGYIKSETFQKGTVFNADWDGSLYNVNVKNGPTIVFEKCNVIKLTK
jgi:hypothetical protein